MSVSLFSGGNEKHRRFTSKLNRLVEQANAASSIRGDGGLSNVNSNSSGVTITASINKIRPRIPRTNPTSRSSSQQTYRLAATPYATITGQGTNGVFRGQLLDENGVVTGSVVDIYVMREPILGNLLTSTPGRGAGQHIEASMRRVWDPNSGAWRVAVWAHGIWQDTCAPT